MAMSRQRGPPPGQRGQPPPSELRHADVAISQHLELFKERRHTPSCFFFFSLLASRMHLPWHLHGISMHVACSQVGTGLGHAGTGHGSGGT